MCGFSQLMFLIIPWLCCGPLSSGEMFFFGRMPNSLADGVEYIQNIHHIQHSWKDPMRFVMPVKKWIHLLPLLSITMIFLEVTIQQIKLGWALFVTYTIIQSIMRSEMCSLHLSRPSVHTVGSRLCSARGAVVDFLSEPGFEPTTLGYLRFQVQRSIH